MIHQLFARLTDSGRQGPGAHRHQQRVLVCLGLWLLPDHLPAAGGVYRLAAGRVNALTSIFSIASVAFWGMVSDRMGSLRKVLILVLLGGSLL